MAFHLLQRDQQGAASLAESIQHALTTLAQGRLDGARLTLLPLRGGWNLLRRRPLLSGVAAINGSPIVDSFKLLALVGVAVSGIVLLAGGGAFGGAGAMIHW